MGQSGNEMFMEYFFTLNVYQVLSFSPYLSLPLSILQTQEWNLELVHMNNLMSLHIVWESKAEEKRITWR